MRPPTIVAATPPFSSQPSNGVLRLRLRRLGVDLHRQVWRENREVGRRAFGDGAARHAEDAGRIHRQQLDEPREGDVPRVHEAVEAERHARREARDAERRAIELDMLLVVVMRCVVGGDHVYVTVDDALQHGVAVSRSAQRRVHLGVGVVGHR